MPKLTDTQALDAIAEFFNRPGPCNGGDLVTVVEDNLRDAGRPILDPDRDEDEEHRDVTPVPQPFRDGKFVSVCSCGEEFPGEDPDDADFGLDQHRLGELPCGCPRDVITSTLKNGGQQCGRCGTTWDKNDQIVTRRGEDLPPVGRRAHA